MKKLLLTFYFICLLLGSYGQLNGNFKLVKADSIRARQTGVPLNLLHANPLSNPYFITVNDTLFNEWIVEKSGFSFPLLAPNGDASNPSYTFLNNDSTGYYLIPPNDLGLSINGTQRVQYQASGVNIVTGDLEIGGTTRIGSTGNGILTNLSVDNLFLNANTISTPSSVMVIDAQGGNLIMQSSNNNVSIDAVGSTNIDGELGASLTSDANVTITPGLANNIILDGLTFPNTDGTNGQVLTTNGAGVLSFQTNIVLDADAYIPNFTGQVNVTSVSSERGFYQRVGSIVNVTVTAIVTHTTDAVLTSFDVSLPIASGLIAQNDLQITGQNENNYLGTGTVVDLPLTGADLTNDTAQVSYVPGTGGGNSGEIKLTFSYIIL